MRAGFFLCVKRTGYYLFNDVKIRRPQCFSHGGSNGDMCWLRVGPTHVEAKLPTFPGFSLQEEHILSAFPTTRRFGETGRTRMDRQMDKRIWQLCAYDSGTASYIYSIYESTFELKHLETQTMMWILIEPGKLLNRTRKCQPIRAQVIMNCNSINNGSTKDVQNYKIKGNKPNCSGYRIWANFWEYYE
jgi:hypothetical protein